MYKIVIIAILLTLGACTQKKNPVHFQDTKTVLAEIDKDHFGSTFISAIALNMAAKNPTEEVTGLIQQIIDDIVKEQGAADEKNRTDQATCDESIASFNQQIAEQVATIASLETAISENTAILNQAVADLEQANKDYDETVAAIQSGTAQREAEHSAWADQDYIFSVQIATLEEGVKLIQHMIHGVAFAQLKGRYEKVIEKLKENDNKKSTLFKPLIASLVQLTTKLNYENVMKILELLNNIRAATIEQQTADRNAEELAQHDWEVLLAQLEYQKRTLADKRQRLQNLIDSTTALLKQLKESLENHRVELENLQISLSQRIQWCDNESATYVAQTTERNRQVDILTKLLNHINEKYQAVSDYVANRGTA